MRREALRWFAVMVTAVLVGRTVTVLAGPEVRPVAETEKQAWLRWVIPLPKQVDFTEMVVLPAGDVRVRIRTGAGELEKAAAERLSAMLGLGVEDSAGAGRFEILVGCCDAQGRLDNRTVADGATLAARPNASQAYVIRPEGRDRLVLTALEPEGVFYAAVTLGQLLEGRLRDAQVAIPLVTVEDWPDLAERGQWGGSSTRDIGWLASYKMNLVEAHASELKVTPEGRGEAKFNEKIILEGRRHALKVVPVITHLDLLGPTGLFEVYPELEGQGERARYQASSMMAIAPCLSSGKLLDVLAGWIGDLASYAHVTDVCVWLSEHHVHCGCDQCQEMGQFVLESRAIVEAWRRVLKEHPDVGLRILLTQGSYSTNDKVLAEIPPDVGVTYYDGGRTYSSTRDEMIYPLLADFAAKGRWLGCYPQLTASWRIVCPWPGPQFIRFRMNEFVDKKLTSLCGYATPDNRLYEFNVIAAAEWTWNAKGRDEREFAAAWATRRGLADPETAADWAVTLGPIGWDVYGSGVPYPWFFGAAAKRIAEGQVFKPGEGPLRYFGDPARFDEARQELDRALRLADMLKDPELTAQTRVIGGYVGMIEALHAIALLTVQEEALDEAQRAALKAHLAHLDEAGRQAVEALKAWKSAVQAGGASSRFLDTVNVTGETVQQVREAVEAKLAPDPS